MTLFAARSIANPWSAQPRIGIAADYATNPELATSGHTGSEARGAVLLDMPVYYDNDSLHFSLLPRARYADVAGYSSVTSNYYRVDSTLTSQSDLGQISVSGGLYRDSSLLYAGQVANGIGVRRDTAVGDIGWLHNVTERLQVQLDGNSQRTVYAKTQQASTLVDYRYSTISPTLGYALDERDTLKLSGGRGWYKALDASTLSNSSTAQLGIDRRLDELWTVSLSAGYSRSTNTLNFGQFELQASQNGTVYSATLVRQSERWKFSVNGSRSLMPSGLAYLTRQDSASLQFSYTPGPHWDFTGSGTYQKLRDPTFSGITAERRFYNADLAVTYHWTEQWVVSVHARTLGQKFGPPTASADSNGVSVEISRQFYRTNL